jgi:hypothetical protein
MKFHVKYYYHPTPQLARRIGDALLGSSLFACEYLAHIDNPKTAMIVIALGCLGKFLSNCFKKPLRRRSRTMPSS